MKHLALLICGLLLVALLVIAGGCATDVITQVAGEGEDSASSCVSCHSDGDSLYDTAEEEEATSAESEGEG